MMPPAVARRTYDAHKAFYDKLQRDVAKAAGKARVEEPDAALANAHAATSPRLTRIGRKSKAAVILISGCQDNQTSMDGDKNGAFTEQLLKVWNGGAYRGTYKAFHAAIMAKMPRTQQPNLFCSAPRRASRSRSRSASSLAPARVCTNSDSAPRAIGATSPASRSRSPRTGRCRSRRRCSKSPDRSRMGHTSA